MNAGRKVRLPKNCTAVKVWQGKKHMIIAADQLDLLRGAGVMDRIIPGVLVHIRGKGKTLKALHQPITLPARQTTLGL